jgi:hypothetical protein
MFTHWLASHYSWHSLMAGSYRAGFRPQCGTGEQPASQEYSSASPPGSPATVAASTSSIGASITIAISALYGDTVAGTSLAVAPQVTPAFTIALQPSTLTIKPGQSGSTTVTTKVKNGYNHALQLTALKIPAGV